MSRRSSSRRLLAFGDDFVESISFPSKLVSGFVQILNCVARLILLAFGLTNLSLGGHAAALKIGSLLAQRIQLAICRGSSFLQYGKSRLDLAQFPPLILGFDAAALRS